VVTTPPYRAALDAAAVARAAGDDAAMVPLYDAAALVAHEAGAELLALACRLEAGWARDRAQGLRPALGTPDPRDAPDYEPPPDPMDDLFA
jgi:hypothetical protein